MSSTAAGLSLCQCPEPASVSQPSVVGFRCDKVENLGGRVIRMKKRGSNMWGSYMTLMTSYFSLQYYCLNFSILFELLYKLSSFAFACWHMVQCFQHAYLHAYYNVLTLDTNICRLIFVHCFYSLVCCVFITRNVNEYCTDTLYY